MDTEEIIVKKIEEIGRLFRANLSKDVASTKYNYLEWEYCGVSESYIIYLAESISSHLQEYENWYECGSADLIIKITDHKQKQKPKNKKIIVINFDEHTDINAIYSLILEQIGSKNRAKS
jgi:hypothetical protein